MSDYAELLNLTNPDAEMTVLTAMLDGAPIAVDLAQLLEPSDFCDPRRGLVFEAITQILMGIDPLDRPTVMARIQRIQRERPERERVFVADDYLDHFRSPNTARAMSYAHSVKRLAWLRGAGDFAHWLVQELQVRPDPEDLFTAAQERWQVLQPRRAESRFVYGWDTIKMHDDIMRERKREREEGTLKRFDWPWQSWNNLIRPLRPGMVGIIAAPDGQGKTTYLEMVAEHWAQRGMHVVYVHLEDAIDYKLDRRRARHALVPLDHIEDDTLTADEEARLADASYTMSAWSDGLHYLDAAGESMTAILRELESRVAEGVCDCVVFDYLDKVQPSRNQAQVYGSNAWERQANDMEQLKTFAERNRVPVLTATQGNKSMQDQGETQTRKAIQGSGQKSHKAQLVVILTREIVGEKGLRDASGALVANPGEYSPIVSVRIDKQNRGRTGSLRQFMVGQFFTVRDIDRLREPNL